MSFLAIRVVWWAVISLPLILTGKLPIGMACPLVFMTGLQWMWGYKIVLILISVLTAKPPSEAGVAPAESPLSVDAVVVEPNKDD